MSNQFSKINAKAYIPPSFVEIIGIIRRVPIQYNDQELLLNLSTFETHIKINHVRRFTSTNPDKTTKPLETVAVHFQAPFLPCKVKLFEGLIFHVSEYKRTPLICKYCIHYGHPARVCKHEHPNCTRCAGPDLEEVGPDVINNTDTSPKCFHCYGSHKGNSTECPIYQRQLKSIQNMSFPNLHIHQSIKQQTRVPMTVNRLSTLKTSNRFEILREIDNNESDPSTEDIEEDMDIDPDQSQQNQHVGKTTKTSSYINSDRSFSTVVRNKKLKGIKPPNLNPRQRNLSRSSTELSLLGNNTNESTPAAIFQYVMKQQDQPIKSLMATQTSTFSTLILQQEKAFQKSLNQITSNLPEMVTKIVEGLLPTIVKQLQTSLAQITKENLSDQ
jgi:hypothetical protein